MFSKIIKCKKIVLLILILLGFGITLGGYVLSNRQKPGFQVTDKSIPPAPNQILIKKAILLDKNKQTGSDVTSLVKTKDGQWLSVKDGQTIRVTFEHPLDSLKDIILFAKPSEANKISQVKVTLSNLDTTLGIFNKIDHEGEYKIFLTNLKTPTDTFDLKISGDVMIDLITDPYVWTTRSDIKGANLWLAIASSADGTKLAAITSSEYIYTSSDSGVTWTQQTGSGARNWYGIASSSDGTKLVAIVFPGYIYTSTDSGVTWTERTSSGSRYWHWVTSSADGTKLAAVDPYGPSFTGGYVWTSADSGATWTQQTGSGARSWNTITSSTTGSTLVAADAGPGLIYVSTDSGVTWNGKAGSGSRTWWTIASSTDSAKLVAAEYGGYLYTSADTGTTWTARTAPGALNWDWVASSNDGTKLAAVAEGYIFTSADSGVTWTQRQGPDSGVWKGVGSSSDGTKLAAVQQGGYISTSADSGATWTVRAQGMTGLRSWWEMASSPDNKYQIAGTWPGYIYTSSDYGATWTERVAAGDRFWGAVAVSSNGQKMIVGDVYGINTTAGYLYLSTDGGSTWTARTGPGLQRWGAVTMSDDGTKMTGVVQYSNVAWTSIDSGVTWTSRTMPSSSAWGGLSTSSDGTKLAAVIQYSSDSVYTSGDGGATWTKQTGSGSHNFWKTATSPDGTKLAAVENSGYIWTSADSGLTWTQQTGSGSRSWNGIRISADGTQLAAAVNNGYLYTSSDSGVTWTAQTSLGSKKWYDVTTSTGGNRISAIVNNEYIYTGITSTTSPIAASPISPSGYSSDNATPDLVFGKASNAGFGLISYTVNLDDGKNLSWSLSGIPTSGNSNISPYVWLDNSYAKVQFLYENDTNAANDRIDVFFKGLSSSPLTEGAHNWKVLAYDTDGNSTTASMNFYIDRTAPYISNLAIANLSPVTAGNIYTLGQNNRTPSFSGKVTDPCVGSTKTNPNGTTDTFDKVCSAPAKITLIMRRVKPGSTDFQDYLSKEYILTGGSKDSSTERSMNFYVTTPYPLEDGYYQTTLKSTDNANNSSVTSAFYLSLNYLPNLTNLNNTVPNGGVGGQPAPTEEKNPLNKIEQMIQKNVVQPSQNVFQSIFSAIINFFVWIFTLIFNLLRGIFNFFIWVFTWIFNLLLRILGRK